MADKRPNESSLLVYEDVRAILDRLRQADIRLGTPDLQGEPAFLSAKKHMTVALKELSQLVELLEGMHTRPKDGVRGTTRE